MTALETTTPTRSGKAGGLPPGPTGGGLAGSYRAYRRDPLRFFLEAAQQYGPLAHFRFVYRNVVLVSGPDHIRHVLLENNANYRKGISYRTLRLLLGQGLLVSEGDLWRRQRRLMQPTFKRPVIHSLAPAMKRSIYKTIERLEGHAASGEAVDLLDELNLLAFRAVGTVLLGTDVEEEMETIEEVLIEVTDFLMHYIDAPIKLPLWVPTPRIVRFNRQRRQLEELVERVVSRCRKDEAGEGASDSGQLLSLLVAARDEDGTGMDDEQLRDELLTLLLAGHETTGEGMAWTFYLLARYPRVLERLEVELEEVLAERDPETGDIEDLQYTGQVIRESMRLFPPAWSFTRNNLAEDSIGGFRIPPDCDVIISPFVNHRLPALWEHPEAFDPERFAPGRQLAHPMFAYFPFGGGQHKCIGRDFSLVEMRLAIAMIAKRFRFELVPGHPVVPDPGISLRPRHGIKVRVIAREDNE